MGRGLADSRWWMSLTKRGHISLRTLRGGSSDFCGPHDLSRTRRTTRRPSGRRSGTRSGAPRRRDSAPVSAEAIVPVTPEQATALAEAVVDLGPDADADVIDAAVAEVMGSRSPTRLWVTLDGRSQHRSRKPGRMLGRALPSRRWRQRCVWISILRWRTPSRLRSSTRTTRRLGSWMVGIRR